MEGFAFAKIFDIASFYFIKIIKFQQFLKTSSLFLVYSQEIYRITLHFNFKIFALGVLKEEKH